MSVDAKRRMRKIPILASTKFEWINILLNLFFMKLFLGVAQIILSVLLALLILLQNRGTGLGGAFGGEGGVYFAKRGLEKFLFILTILVSILFIASIIANLFIN